MWLVKLHNLLFDRSLNYGATDINYDILSECQCIFIIFNIGLKQLYSVEPYSALE